MTSHLHPTNGDGAEIHGYVESRFQPEYIKFSHDSICRLLADGPLAHLGGKRVARLYIDGDDILVRFDPFFGAL